MDELEFVYDEETGTWSKKEEPYMVIECQTKEDFEELSRAWEHWLEHKERGEV